MLLLPLAMLALVFVGIFAFRYLVESRRTTAEVQANRDVLNHLEGLLAAVTDAETGQRGFLLTGRQEYLQPFNRGIQLAPQELEALSQAVQSVPERESGVRRLQPLIFEKVAELRRTIRLRETSGLQAAIQVVQTDAGKKTMDAIRQIAAQMEASESARLSESVRRGESQGQKSLLVTIAGSIGLFLLVGLATLTVNRSTAQRERLIVDLHERRELLQTTLASIGDAVMVTDAAGAVTFLNGVAEGLTGWKLEEALGKAVDQVFRIVNEESRQVVENPVSKVLREGCIVGLANHTVLVHRGGKDIPIEDSGAPIRAADGATLGVVLVFRDVTEMRQAEKERLRFDEQIRQTAKLESLGVLAGGIAHDFNNLLASRGMPAWRWTYCRASMKPGL